MTITIPYGISILLCWQKGPRTQTLPGLSKGLWWAEETIHRRTGLDDARSYKAVPDWNGYFKVRYRSSTHSVGLQWRQTPHLLYFKNPFPNQMKLWNLWSRTTGYYSSTWRIASLYSRICPYNNNPIRSQELDVLPRSQETKPTASTMVPIPIWIWC